MTTVEEVEEEEAEADIEGNWGALGSCWTVEPLAVNDYCSELFKGNHAAWALHVLFMTNLRRLQ